MAHSTAYEDEQGRVVVAFDPLVLDCTISATIVSARMTRQQAHELLWALETTLGGDREGTDDDVPQIAAEAPSLRTTGCGDDDCTCPECPTGRTNTLDPTPCADGCQFVWFTRPDGSRSMRCTRTSCPNS